MAQDPRACVDGRTGGHHVVYQQDSTAANPLWVPDRERSDDFSLAVGSPLVSELAGIHGSPQNPWRDNGASELGAKFAPEGSGQKRCLIETAIGKTTRMQGNRHDQVGTLADQRANDRRGQGDERGGEIGPILVLETTNGRRRGLGVTPSGMHRSSTDLVANNSSGAAERTPGTSRGGAFSGSWVALAP